MWGIGGFHHAARPNKEPASSKKREMKKSQCIEMNSDEIWIPWAPEQGRGWGPMLVCFKEEDKDKKLRACYMHY